MRCANLCVYCTVLLCNDATLVPYYRNYEMRRNARELDGRIVLRANRIRAHELTSGSRSPPPRRSDFCSLWIQSRSCAAPQAAGATRLDSQSLIVRRAITTRAIACCVVGSARARDYSTVQYAYSLLFRSLTSSLGEPDESRTVL